MQRRRPADAGGGHGLADLSRAFGLHHIHAAYILAGGGEHDSRQDQGDAELSVRDQSDLMQRAKRNEDRIRDKLFRAAEKGAPCPTNAEISEALGIAQTSIGDALRRMEKTGRIMMQAQGWARRASFEKKDGTVIRTGWTDRKGYKAKSPRPKSVNTVAKPKPKPEPETKVMRRCLGPCGEMFPSSWIGERMCKRCR